MVIALIITNVLWGLFCLWVNDSWYRTCEEEISYWHKRCLELICEFYGEEESHDRDQNDRDV